MTNFNLRLRRNANAEWEDEYIDYDKLTRIVKQQQREQQQREQQQQQQLKETRDVPAEDLEGGSALAATSYGTLSQPLPRTSSMRRSRSTSYLRLLAASASETERLVLARRVDPFEDALEGEYNKVERAFTRHVTHYTEQLALLRKQYRPNAPLAAQESFKAALVELHRLLNLLSTFALLNYKGFVKILKKHEKAARVSDSTGSSWYLDHTHRLEGYTFTEARACHDLMHSVEQTFSVYFCDGNHALALATLMTKREESVSWEQIHIGIKIGSCLILLVWVGWDSLVVPTFRSSQEANVIPLVNTKAYPVYRGVGCLLLLHWLVGVSLFVWRKARINYRYIFELDPRNTQQYPQVFSDATNMTIVFLTNVLLYYKVVNGYFPEELLHRGYYPLLLCVYAFYFYVVRTWGRQLGLLRTVFEIVCSPFYAVTFFHTFVGNYLTSVVKVSQDLCWSACFFATKEFLERDRPPSAALLQPEAGCSHNFYYVNVAVPLICALPLWWRFLQCLRRIADSRTWWPSLPNAFKYALAQVVALFGLFHPFYVGSGQQQPLLDSEAFRVAWIVLFTLGSLYTWVWDVTMDWGLGQPETKLRGYRQMFSRSWIYTAAVVADFFLCFTWSLSIIARQRDDEFLRYVQPFTMVAELFRRTLWSFFSLENEHLRNTYGFRRANVIPLHCDSAMSDDGDDLKKVAAQQPAPIGGLALLANISLLVCAVLGLSAAAIEFEK